MSAAEDSTQIPWTYADWAEALCAHYFAPEMAGVPVMFLVDEDHLATIHPSGSPAEAVADLARVVQARLTPNHRDGAFQAMEREGRAWRLGQNSDECPPFLPLLAVC